MSEDWKQKHANDCDAAVYHPLVQAVIDEQMFNLEGAAPEALMRYGLSKIAMYAAQVARAQALGFDPQLLKMTPTEANEQMLQLAQRAVEMGKPVFLIETENPS